MSIQSSPISHQARRFVRRKAMGHRNGAVAAECALAMPLILLLMFATLEICSALYVRQTALTIAYEGARVGVKRRATRTDVENTCSQLLLQRGIVGAQVIVSPSDFSTLAALQPITVTVQAPLAGNTWFLYQFLANGRISGTVKMVREFNE